MYFIFFTNCTLTKGGLSLNIILDTNERNPRRDFAIIILFTLHITMNPAQFLLTKSIFCTWQTLWKLVFRNCSETWNTCGKWKKCSGFCKLKQISSLVGNCAGMFAGLIFGLLFLLWEELASQNKRMPEYVLIWI